MKLSPWIKFFRFPNLPTAPGDAIAGAVITCALASNSDWVAEFPLQIIGAGLAALFLYMFGLADNDVSGAEEDQTQAPNRPIPAGLITLSQAKVARVLCLLFSIVVAGLFKLPLAWSISACLLVVVILLYNRYKTKCKLFGFVSMGLCRGLSFFTGAAAMWSISPDALFSATVGLGVLGWTGYICAVTWLAHDEHEAEAPMSVFRFIPGLVMLLPLVGLVLANVQIPFVSIFCSACAYLTWVLAVLPLGRAHTPDIRRRAVGNSIGALLYLQTGVILYVLTSWTIGIVAVLFLAKAAIRRVMSNAVGS